MKKLSILALSGVAIVAATAAYGQASKNETTEVAVVEKGPEGRLRAGVMACEIEGGIGLILGSSKKVTCEFVNKGSGETETYEGRINKFGLDIGVTGKQYMRWVVFAPESHDGTEGLGGSYAGVAAAGALGLSFGGNALIGGSDKSFVLQPVSLQAGTGLNVAVGVASMTLAKS